MRISDWSSDVCSSDLGFVGQELLEQRRGAERGAIAGTEAQPVVERPVGAQLVGPVAVILVERAVRLARRLHAGDARRGGAGQLFVERPVRQQPAVELCKSLLGKTLSLGDSRGTCPPHISRPGYP